TPAITFHVDTDSQITATVPVGAVTGKISVTSPTGTGTSTANFTVLPKITSFNPTSGRVGDPVTITGTSFTGATAVQFNTTPAIIFHVDSDTQITATVPAGATTGPISVKGTSGSLQLSSDSFKVLPTITSFTPTVGKI